MEYWKQIFKCPFYINNGKTQVGCSVGKLNFPDKITTKEVLIPYCANEWEKCPIAMALTKHEERKEQEQKYENKKRTDKRA